MQIIFLDQDFYKALDSTRAAEKAILAFKQVHSHRCPIRMLKVEERYGDTAEYVIVNVMVLITRLL